MIDFLWSNVLKLKKDTDSTYHHLKKNFLFQDLTSWELHFVEDIVNVRTYKATEIIFKQSDMGAGMYIITSGKVQIQAENYDPKLKATQTHLITTLGPQDFFGELSLIESETRRSATSIALEDTSIIGFFKADLMEIVKRNPTIGVKILLRLSEVLGERLRQTTAKLSELNT
jgi:CRP/FNR family cyclic AMP-dependent transcriptional regulator